MWQQIVRPFQQCIMFPYCHSILLTSLLKKVLRLLQWFNTWHHTVVSHHSCKSLNESLYLWLCQSKFTKIYIYDCVKVNLSDTKNDKHESAQNWKSSMIFFTLTTAAKINKKYKSQEKKSVRKQKLSLSIKARN